MSMNFVSYLLTEIWETWKNGSGLSREVASGASCSLADARFVCNGAMMSLIGQFMQLMRDADYLSARHTTEKLARIEQTMQLVLDEVAEVELSNRQLIEWSISWLNGSDDLLARRMRVLLILKYNENQQQATLSCFGNYGSETLCEEVVACITRGDLDDLSGFAKLLHIIHEHNFYCHFNAPFSLRP